MDNKLIFSVTLCELLIRKGETLIGARPDKKDPRKTVYLIRNSGTLNENLQKSLEELGAR